MGARPPAVEQAALRISADSTLNPMSWLPQVGKALLGAIRGALRLPVATDKADSKLIAELGLGGFRGAPTQAKRTTFEDGPVQEERQPHVVKEPTAAASGGGKAAPISGDDIGGDFADFEV